MDIGAPRKFLSNPRFLIFATAVLVYGQTLSYSFLHWDDDAHILRHPPLNLDNLTQTLTQPYYGLFIPITYLLWGGIGSVFNLFQIPFHPFVYHALNLLLHILNSLQVFDLIGLVSVQRNLSQEKSPKLAPFAIGVGTMFFLLHPLQAATVSWISGARDLLSAAFGLWATRTFLRSGNLKKVTVLYILGILSKPSLVVLPLALLLLRSGQKSDLKPQGEPKTGRWIIAWLLMGAVIAIWTRSAQEFSWMPSVDWWLRPLIAVDALGFYLTKVLFPYPLSTDYGRTAAWVTLHTAFIFTGICLAGSCLLFWNFRKKLHPSIGKGLGWSLFMLFPTLGWLPSAQQSMSTVADHYVYLPLVGLSWGIAALTKPLKSHTAKAGIVAWLALLGTLTFTRSQVWKTDLTLFQSMLNDNPESVNAHIGMGNLDSEMGNEEQSLLHFRKAHELAPENATALANYAITLERTGNDLEVIKEIAPIIPIISRNLEASQPRLQTRQEASPFLIRILDTVAASEMRLNQFEAARENLCQSFRLDPNFPRTIELWSQLKELYPSKRGVQLSDCES